MITSFILTQAIDLIKLLLKFINKCFIFSAPSLAFLLLLYSFLRFTLSKKNTSSFLNGSIGSTKPVYIKSVLVY